MAREGYTHPSSKQRPRYVLVLQPLPLPPSCARQCSPSAGRSRAAYRCRSITPKRKRTHLLYPTKGRGDGSLSPGILIPTQATSPVSLGTQCGRTTLVAPGVGSSAARTARPLGSLGVNPTPATAAGITISRSTALVATPGHRSGAATASSMFASKQTSGDQEAAQEAASLN